MHWPSDAIGDRTANMATSMRLAKHESERDPEELIAKIVVDVQDPAAPVFEAARRGKGSHDTGRLITRLSEVIYYGAAAIDQNLLRVGAVKIDLGHVLSPTN
jgi:hypothetical protein